MTNPLPEIETQSPYLWMHRRGTFDLSRRGLIMGVLNVTPDSFSDGGAFLDTASALQGARQLEEAGADILDIGGESTRPGAAPVSAEEELQRVIPVIRGIRERSDIVISIDTWKSEVAEEAVKAGADIVNDVTAFQDPAMPGVVVRNRTGVVLMHMQGTPATMQVEPHYEDALGEVRDFLRQKLEFSLSSGMVPQAAVLDPGIGFGKTPAHNAALIRGIPELAALGRPLLLGVSRKSFLKWLAEAPEVADRFWPGVALTCLGREWGARIFRVHDPAPHKQALRMTEAILQGGAQ